MTNCLKVSRNGQNAQLCPLLEGTCLGIYKSLGKHVLKKDETTNDKSETDSTDDAGIRQGQDILYAIFDIMLLAICHEYPLQCWRTVWTLLIEKELGNLHLDQLHCIMIFEANWQLMLKWHSSYGFLPKTEKARTLSYEQGGGHKGRSMINQVAQQIVGTKIIHLCQCTALDLYLDLWQCFDMMVKACHNLVCCQHGADNAYLKLHAKTHQAMRYYV